MSGTGFAPRSLPLALSISLSILLSITTSAGAQYRLGIAESDDLEIILAAKNYEFLVPHVGGSMRNALQFHEALFGWTPSEKPTVFLHDFNDMGQGWANTVPFNRITIGVSPAFYTFETLPAIDRMFWIANHELTHLVTMEQAAGSDLAWRRFFAGKVAPDDDDPLSIFYNYLTNPRWNSPRWYHEGIAVFMETWMAGGIGRAQGAYDEMVFRSMVKDDSYFYDVVGLESEGTVTDFQTGVNAYLYGTRFMSYLAYTHGPQSVIDWTSRHPGSKRYFASQFEHVYGVPLKDEWRRWIAFEKEWQTSNLAAIHEHPVTPTRDLSTTALGSISRAFIDHDAGKLYVGARYPGQVAHLAAIDLESGKIEKVRDLKGAVNYYVTSIAFDPQSKVFYLTSDNNEWRDLWQLDAATGKQKRLANDLRVGDLAFNRASGTLWGVQHLDGSSILVRIPPPYDTWFRVHTFPYGTDLYDIDVSPDGSLPHRWAGGGGRLAEPGPVQARGSGGRHRTRQRSCSTSTRAWRPISRSPKTGEASTARRTTPGSPMSTATILTSATCSCCPTSRPACSGRRSCRRTSCSPSGIPARASSRWRFPTARSRR